MASKREHPNEAAPLLSFRAPREQVGDAAGWGARRREDAEHPRAPLRKEEVRPSHR